MKKVLVIVDVQNDFVDGALGTKEAVEILPYVKEEISKKYDDVFDDYGENLSDMEFTKCHEKDGKLYKCSKDGTN